MVWFFICLFFFHDGLFFHRLRRIFFTLNLMVSVKKISLNILICVSLFCKGLSDDLDDLFVDDKEFDEFLGFFEFIKEACADVMFVAGEHAASAGSPAADLDVFVVERLDSSQDGE